MVIIVFMYCTDSSVDGMSQPMPVYVQQATAAKCIGYGQLQYFLQSADIHCFIVSFVFYLDIYCVNLDFFRALCAIDNW